MFWHARCNPKMVMPARKTGIVWRTVASSAGSVVKADATTVGKSIISNISTRLKENITVTATRKHCLTRALSPCP